MLEDTPTDAELEEHELRKAGITFTSLRVTTREAFVLALEQFHPGIILSDYNLPGFDGKSALEIVRRDHPEIPVIMVTGALSDIEAVELIHAGAKDYVLKDRLARLGPAVQRVLSMEQGIRARKAAEKGLRESLTRYTTLTESANDAIICLRPDGAIELWNRMAQQMFGYSEEEAIGKQLHHLISPLRYQSQADDGMRLFGQTGTGPVLGKTLEITAIRKSGEEFPVEMSIASMSFGGEWHATGIIRDITERKQVEIKLELFRALIDNSSDAIEVLDPATLRYLDINETGCSDLGYSREEIMSMSIPDIDPSFDESTKKIIISQMRQPEGARFESVHRRKDGTTYPVEISAKLIELDKPYVVDIVRDITGRKKDEEERRISTELLGQTLTQTIEAIAAMVEARDPYTAGHQRRVAALSSAIATEMGYPADMIHGLALAAIIHDLGKIHIPAEILSKPGLLGQIEYELIKCHPQAGYEIIKDVQFPWPIAQMVLQHHERLDGSGYPHGLTAEQILPEAKILAVADVVEAMVSHRPYRPGLGVEAALKEIAKGRGTLYDPQVVDACTVLIHERGYVFPS